MVLNSLNENDAINQATNLAEIYSNPGNQFSLTESRSLDIGDEMLFLKDKPTCAARFKFSSRPTPKNILADILEMFLINLLPNSFHCFKNFFYLPVSVAVAKRTLSPQKQVKKIINVAKS